MVMTSIWYFITSLERAGGGLFVCYFLRSSFYVWSGPSALPLGTSDLLRTVNDVSLSLFSVFSKLHTVLLYRSCVSFNA